VQRPFLTALATACLFVPGPALVVLGVRIIATETLLGPLMLLVGAFSLALLVSLFLPAWRKSGI
jgi:hypothetical protein